jgi:hypothetical protein
MRTLVSVLTVTLLLAFAGPAYVQSDARHLDLKVEPMSYAFGGGGGHVGVQAGDWKYTLEGFGLDIPQSLHGNDAFEASLVGGELHAEHFFGENLQGFYAGPEAGIVRREVTHSRSGASEQKVLYSIGLRGGYRWYTGLGNLYISLVVGVSYTLNGESATIGGDTFESAPVGPWGTVGIGWSFSR